MKTSKLISDALLQARTIRGIAQAQQESHPNSYLLELATDQIEALLRIEGAIIALENMQPALPEVIEAPDVSELEHFMTLPSRDETESMN